MANTSILSAFERMWQHIVAALGNKSDVTHTHDFPVDSVNGKIGAVELVASDIGAIPQQCAYINSAVSADTLTEPFVLLNISSGNTELRSLLGNANYAYIQTQYYSAKTGWRLQVAYSYAVNPAKMAFRTEYQGTWSSWTSSSGGVTPAAYVVSEATSSGLHLNVGTTLEPSFTYRVRKWSNGMVEIFGTSAQFETSVTTPWGSLFESPSISFPHYNCSLTDVIYCNVYFSTTNRSNVTNSIAWTEGSISDSLTSPGATYICRADQVQSVVGKIQTYTVGYYT